MLNIVFGHTYLYLNKMHICYIWLSVSVSIHQHIGRIAHHSGRERASRLRRRTERHLVQAHHIAAAAEVAAHRVEQAAADAVPPVRLDHPQARQAAAHQTRLLQLHHWHAARLQAHRMGGVQRLRHTDADHLAACDREIDLRNGNRWVSVLVYRNILF